jgi:putative ABC transport system ATP-binding protein
MSEQIAGGRSAKTPEPSGTRTAVATGTGIAEPLLAAEGLGKTFHISIRPHVAVDGVSLTVRRGELVAIMGPSGCGKSTLLHLLGGLEPPDSGRVVIDGRDITAMDERSRTIFRRERIGFVFQFFNLIPNLTAAENIALPMRIAGEAGAGFERVADLMRDLNLRGLQGHRPEEISGGEQQRVAIARALLMEPAIVMADEPTGNLDFTTGREVLDLIWATSSRAGQTAILVTHSAQAAAYADRVLAMRDGKLVDEIELGRREDHSAAPLISRLAQLGL